MFLKFAEHLDVVNLNLIGCYYPRSDYGRVVDHCPMLQTLQLSLYQSEKSDIGAMEAKMCVKVDNLATPFVLRLVEEEITSVLARDGQLVVGTERGRILVWQFPSPLDAESCQPIHTLKLKVPPKPRPPAPLLIKQETYTSLFIV